MHQARSGHGKFKSGFVTTQVIQAINEASAEGIAATNAVSDGWLVVPENGAAAASTASTPASDAASKVAS